MKKDKIVNSGFRCASDWFLSRSSISQGVGMLLCVMFLYALTGLFTSSPAQAASAGYSIFYVPADETNMAIVFEESAAGTVNNYSPTGCGTPGTPPCYTDPIRSIIGMTAWADDTRIYVDHWEDGYDMDPDNPEATADEVCPVQPSGGQISLTSLNVPSVVSERANYTGNPDQPSSECVTAVSPCGSSRTANGCYYDGKDKIYAVGGAVTLTRTSLPESVTGGGGPTTYTPANVQAVSWEVYPVRPQLTTYILPFGENLGTGFEIVHALVQATQNNTAVQVDFNDDGVFDAIDLNRDGDCNDAEDGNAGNGYTVTLDEGQVLLMNRSSDGNGGTGCTAPNSGLNTGAKIVGSDTLQVQYTVGDPSADWEIRNYSAFPRGLWDDEYYAPVPGFSNGNGTDIYLHNPHATDLIVDYTTRTGSGSITIPPNGTTSFFTATGGEVPTNTGVHFKSQDGRVFWGVSAIDRNSPNYDWSYSLVPAYLFDDQYFIGWAPSNASIPPTGGDVDAGGVFLSVARDNTIVFVDYDANGTVDSTYTLNRLQTIYLCDRDNDPECNTSGNYAPENDADMSGASIWATGPFIAAYGQNPDATTATAGFDLGYTTLPGKEWIELVLDVEKTTDPVIVGTGMGEVTKYTIVVSSDQFDVDNITVVDTLATGWAYCTGTNTPVAGCLPPVITFPDGSTSADAPSVSGQNLTWGSGQFTGGQLDMLPNQELKIEYSLYTTASHAAGSITTSPVEASGSRTVGSPSVTQTFTATDRVFNLYTDNSMTVEKWSKTPGHCDSDTGNDVGILYPGDSFCYRIKVTNTGTGTLTGIGVFDTLPVGVTYTTSSTSNSHSTVADRFSNRAYTNQDGTRNWGGNWIETGDSNGATGDDILITTNGELRLNNDDALASSILSRQVDLSGATSAVLSFKWRTTAGVDSADSIRVCARASSAAAWDCTLTGGVFTGITGISSGTYSVDLAAEGLGALTATAQISFQFTADDQYAATAANESFFVDDLSITYNVSDTNGSPPDLLPGGYLYSLLPGQNLSISFNVTVDDPLATGITELTNTAAATSTQIPVPIEASVTDPVINPSQNSATVGDRVWLDSDGDGVQDVGETGLANVQVTLKDEWGTPVATTTTDSQGRYTFTNIAPGNGYYVQVTGGLPSGLTQSAPVGRTDNRTASFNLTDGQTYTDADMGYKPAASTATFGDLVWIDADGDGVRDAGEPGLEDIRVRLYTDTNGNGVIDSGETYIETTTGPGGSYLFTGLSAGGGEDYIVSVDATQSDLSGYTETTTLTRSYTDVSADGVYMNADFGFRNDADTHTIRDRVWIDADENDQDDGESGIAGVTVALLDAGGNIIATTTTDADGYFQFTGVPEGVRYSWEITDQAGVLNNYYGTTTAAQAGRFQMPSVLTGDTDYTAEPTEPHFGYNLNRSIGDTVFNDLDGDGSQDTGEPGISGVQVKLYEDDNGNGVIDAGDSLLATLVTDSNGRYLFSGLSDGNYIVSIESPPSGYSYTGTGGNADSDSGTTGQQQPASISGGASELTNDFPYQATTPRTLSGVFWSDSNNNGENNSEPGIAGVTVELWRDVNDDGVIDSGDIRTSVTTTSSTGAYSFEGIPDGGDYIVRVTDTDGVLSDYTATYEKNTPYDGLERIQNLGADVNDLNFGYYKPSPTYVVLSSFRAYESNGQTVVEWETALEVGTIGFYLYRLDEVTKDYRQVNEELLPALLTDSQGGTYRYVDAEARVGGTYTYKLVEIESRHHGNKDKVKEKENEYGPFTVTIGADSAQTPVVSDYERKPRDRSASEKAREKASKEEKEAFKERKKTRKGNMMKITVTEDGLYYIDSAEVSSLLGLTLGKARSDIKQGKLSLTNQGKNVAYLAADKGVGFYFYGKGIESLYTRENVYWLKSGTGVLMQTVAGKAPSPATGTMTFEDTVHVEQNLGAVTGLFTDPEEDYWIWDYVIAANAAYEKKDFTVPAPGAASSGTAALSVHLLGATATKHHVVISLNGVTVGESQWEGTVVHDLNLPVDASLLVDGDNTVQVKAVLDAGVSYSIFYADSFDLSYPRYYKAVGNRLALRGDGNSTVTAEGFSSSSVLVFDVSDPLKPRYVTATKVDRSGSAYRVSFTPTTAQTQYLVVTSDAGSTPVSVLADKPSTLKASANGADMVIITVEELKATAESLASYRKAQGLETVVAELEDICDDFNYGISSPHAIRQFLAYAWQNWEKPPRYVLLAGGGSYDYQDYLGYSDNLVPPLMVGTPWGLFASDTRLADVEGDDGVPEMAVGRLPAVTSEELQNFIDKIMAYESAVSDPWAKKVVMVADNADTGGNFPADSDALADLISPEYSVEKIYLSEYSKAQARRMLLQSLNGGAFLMNYVGHSGLDSLAQEGILKMADVASLNNGEKLPVMLGLTCVIGRFEIPGYDTLSEAMLSKADGGMVAVWAPTGLSVNAEARVLNEGFFGAVFAQGEKTLGEAVLTALEEYALRGDPTFLFMRDIYNLLGDPALQMK